MIADKLCETCRSPVRVVEGTTGYVPLRKGSDFMNVLAATVEQSHRVYGEKLPVICTFFPSEEIWTADLEAHRSRHATRAWAMKGVGVTGEAALRDLHDKLFASQPVDR